MLASTTENIIATTTSTASVASTTSAASQTPKLPPLGEEIFDIAGTVDMSYPWLLLFEKIALAAVGLGIVWLIYKMLTAPVERVRKPIVQSPEVMAKRAIKRMKLSEIWEKQDIKSICENVAAILKNYALDEYKLSIGAAATSDEFIPDLINGHVRNEVLSEIRNLLAYCDEIRYTGSENDSRTPESLVDSLEKLISIKGWRR